MDISKYKWRRVHAGGTIESHVFEAPLGSFSVVAVAVIYKTVDGWYVHQDRTGDPNTYTSLKDVDNIEEAKAVVEAILRLS